MFQYRYACIFILIINIKNVFSTTSFEIKQHENIDPNGYILFCLCMGRFGNQAEQFLGGLAFAKLLNRTLILPPWRTYKNIPFTDWFEIEPIREYHRVIEAYDFMSNLAPRVWPDDKRIGFCWLPSDKKKTDCNMKQGNPFENFWNELYVDFTDYAIYQLSYDEHSVDDWHERFPPKDFPVISMKEAPAQFPMLSNNRKLQKYLKWSQKILDEVYQHQQTLFNSSKYIGIHLRNDIDWLKACSDIETYHTQYYMASPQCLEETEFYATKKLCYPSDEEIFRLLKNIVILTQIKNIYVATDKRSMVKEIGHELSKQNVIVKHLDPWLPVIDIAMLAHSDYFIGNCVSSFTSAVKRERDIKNLPSAFWGFSN
ncbi:unnamed protein product [Didymodactylos carnosus]|uniref:GDP-fucose protein O-fucosyltransferase 1 n=1 Tax=Didymodactylos carnosus TaxID=1234261 RepID=A0A813ST23_9BILA|nr:unnamed protein product [Didymodactylos carnosus]CAF0902101.1 unnamed protein product [Didymodactylos carnosus]CAF3585226.1 unnamed protein product [Didymodactylos carnosus]CAF3682606.1 unnamed protein product [Didymodactylos carnosus]